MEFIDHLDMNLS